MLSVRLTASALTALNSALDSGGWHELETDEGTVRLDLGQVVYVRVESDEHRVGFGA